MAKKKKAKVLPPPIDNSRKPLDSGLLEGNVFTQQKASFLKKEEEKKIKRQKSKKKPKK